jgi:LacI family transcriptional regulator
MASRAQNITIHDVAAKAGVSIKTVSRVLRNEPDVAAATRKKVQEAIDALSYAPHPSARGLASTVTNVIGLVAVVWGDLGLPPWEGLRGHYEYRMRLQLGALHACEQAGFGLRIEMVGSSGRLAAEHLIGCVRRREVGGYVLTPLSATIPGLREALDAAGVKYVALAGSAPSQGPCLVGADDRSAMRALTRIVLAAGHRRIGLIRGNAGWLDTEERQAGFLDALAEANVAPEPALIVPGMFEFAAGREAAAKLLDLPRPPTAIMASSDDIAAGVISLAHERGLKLPDQLSVTGFDDFEIAQRIWPPLTSVKRPLETMADIAARQVIAMLRPKREDQGFATRQVQVQGEVVLRQSVAPPAAA